jgi:hypothetical protein
MILLTSAMTISMLIATALALYEEAQKSISRKPTQF